MADYNFEFSKWDQDLSFLTTCLTETLTELGRPDLASIVPWTNAPSSTIPRSGESARVYSLAFQLLNSVEENTANQARRRNDSLGQTRLEKGRWRDVLPALTRTLTEEQITSLLGEVSVCPTLTAHPTEAKRATILEHYRSLYLLQVRLENTMYSSLERDLIRQEIKAHLERIFRTGEVFIHRPDVSSELSNVIHYLTEVFPPVITMMVKRFLMTWSKQGLSSDRFIDQPVFPGLHFGNWVGGDRDGHPLVTAEVTANTLRTLRQQALDLQRAQVRRLAGAISLSDSGVSLPAEFNARFQQLVSSGGAAAEAALARNPGEPFRQFLNLMCLCIPASASELHAHHYQRAQELTNDLGIIARALQANGALRLVQEDLLPAIQIAHTFGFHLAKLDIRQNSTTLDKALGQFVTNAHLTDTAWEELSVSKKKEFIRAEVQLARPFVSARQRVGAEGDETRNLFTVLAEHVATYGTEGIGSFIVSMTRSCEDLLSVYLLAREGGLLAATNGHITYPLHVVPLFETIEDLHHSTSILEEFITHPVVRASSTTFPHVQEVMIGYSDSNKDGGILASFHALQQAQQQLLAVAAKHARALRFFHGRGGTISRGAGPTDRFLASLPVDVLRHGLKVTEQGESISQKYANLLTASYNLELLYAGTLRHVAIPTTPPSKPANVTLKTMAHTSFAAYRALITRDGFVPFFRSVTPLDVIERSKIGSRPTRRLGATSLADLRAIPWVFAWNQSRFLLSGWYGVGHALEQLQRTDPASIAMLKDEIASRGAIAYLFLNIETSLYSASEEIMQLYATLCTDNDLCHSFMEIITTEYRRSKQLVAELLGGDFASRRPRMHKTLALREKPLADLHVQQVELLGTWRRTSDDNILEDLLVVTHAIASGLRTTG